MGASIRNRQIRPATSSEFEETFRFCRALLAEHFAKKGLFNLTLFWLIYSWNTFTNFYHFLRFLQEKNFKGYRKTDETLSFVSQIVNPIAYSDSSWKTASESIGVQNISSSFSLTFRCTVCSSGYRKYVKNSISKTEWTRYETYMVL